MENFRININVKEIKYNSVNNGTLPLAFPFKNWTLKQNF